MGIGRLAPTWPPWRGRPAARGSGEIARQVQPAGLRATTPASPPWPMQSTRARSWSVGWPDGGNYPDPSGRARALFGRARHWPRNCPIPRRPPSRWRARAVWRVVAYLMWSGYLWRRTATRGDGGLPGARQTSYWPPRRLRLALQLLKHKEAQVSPQIDSAFTARRAGRRVRLEEAAPSSRLLAGSSSGVASLRASFASARAVA